MYKVMLADDNYPILMYLAESIPWENLGMTVIGTHENGMKALENAKTRAPDILITDIGMPVMNGLELIEEIKRFKPDLLSLIISCHEEFQFVQRALQLNVSDYILKGAINIEQIIERLKHFVGILADRSPKPNSDELTMVKNQWIRHTLNHDIWDIDRWAGQARSYGIDLTNQTCLPIMGCVSNALQVKQRTGMSETLFGYATANMLSELISYDNCRLFFQYNANQFIICILLDREQALSIKAITDQLTAIQTQLHDIMSLQTTFIIGRQSESPHRFLASLVELWKRREAFFYLDNQIVNDTNDIMFSNENMFDQYYAYLDAFRNCLFDSGTDGVCRLISSMLQWIIANRFRPDAVKSFVSKMLIELQIKLKDLQTHSNLNVEDSINEVVARLNTILELERYLKQYMEKLFALMEDGFVRSTRKDIMSVQRYILSNLDKSISLHDVAGQLHMNHSYLSRLFKKETGENFIEYTTRMKLKRAKELLDHTEKSVEEISDMLGYEKVYFYKMFKRSIGLTPNEYRMYYKAEGEG